MPSEFQKKSDRELDSGLRGLSARKQGCSLAEIRGANLHSRDYPGLSEKVALREAGAGCCV